MADETMKGKTDDRAAKVQKRWTTVMGGPVDFGISTLASEKTLDPDSVGTEE